MDKRSDRVIDIVEHETVPENQHAPRQRSVDHRKASHYNPVVVVLQRIANRPVDAKDRHETANQAHILIKQRGC